jgi:phage-related protein
MKEKKKKNFLSKLFDKFDKNLKKKSKEKCCCCEESCKKK